MKTDKENKVTPVETSANSAFESVEFTEFDFEFVRKETDEKIHDEKFQSKPTTFAKDALRRFAKNKASVVGAIIIGILLLGSFLSIFSPYDISNPHGEYVKMMPKIRDGGDGFWDGTIGYYDQPFDEVTGMPVDVNPKAVVPGSVTMAGEPVYLLEANIHAKGGYMRFLSTKFSTETTTTYSVVSSYTVKSSLYNVYADFAASDDLKLSVTYGGDDGIKDDQTATIDNKIVPFNIELYGNKTNKYTTSPDTTILLAENLTVAEGEDATITVDDIAAKMNAAGHDTLYYAGIRFVFANCVDEYSYILVKSVSLTCAETSSDQTKARCAGISFDDANWVAANSTTQVYPESYWRSNARTMVYKAVRHSCNYRLDQYIDVFGEKEEVVGLSEINTYIANGWCTMSDPNDVTTFALTNPESTECPVREIYSVSHAGGATQYNSLVLKYRRLGFSEMPKFIFGTDSSGYDLLTLSLSCLKNSLLLAIITSAICLSIGLVWGSISGYFGGNVDLFMERITDILSGVPWIVVMTLIMLLLGRTYITFGIAVCLTGWIGTASRTRTQFYRFKGREYVLASRTLGASDMRLIFRHILPNGSGTIVTGAVLMIPSTIFSEATLSYLGLGLQGTASFGVVLSDNQIYLSSRPALIIFPSIIISLLMISFNLFGNGLRDALNPTLKGGEQ